MFERFKLKNLIEKRDEQEASLKRTYEDIYKLEELRKKQVVDLAKTNAKIQEMQKLLGMNGKLLQTEYDKIIEGLRL